MFSPKTNDYNSSENHYLKAHDGCQGYFIDYLLLKWDIISYYRYWHLLLKNSFHEYVNFHIQK